MNIVKSYFAHLIAYVGAAYVVVTKIDPNLLPPNVAAVVTTWGPIVGAGLAAVHHVSVAPTTPVATVAKVHFLTVLAALLVAVSILAGCASFSAKVTSPAAQPYVTAGAQVAVGIAEAQGVTAAQINSVAKQALAADSGSTATLATVAATVNVQLAKLKLTGPELLAAGALEAALGTAIQAQVGTNANVAAAQAAVADVLNAVIAATGG